MAAARLGWELPTEPEAWSLGLDPASLVPVEIQVRAGSGCPPASATASGLPARTERGYRATASRIAVAHPSPTRMSSRQRLGMVADMWELAVSRAHGAPAPRRRSCCLVYALPGCHECASCPRLP